MDFGELAEELVPLVLVAAAALVLGRAGFALARVLECRLMPHRGFHPEAEGRLLLLEDECTSLRRQMTDLRERQDFMDSLFLPRTADRSLPPPRDPGPG